MKLFRRNESLATWVDLDDLAEQMRAAPALEPPDAYAPKRAVADYIEEAIEHIESFLALPLKEIDDAVAALEAEHEATIAKGQEIRDIIMRVRKDYLDQIDRRRKLTQIAKESFAELADKVAALDAPTESTQATGTDPNFDDMGNPLREPS